MSKKLAIIGTAQRLFYERGIRATKMIDVANDLKISKKTLYLIFRSKELLVDATYMSMLEEINERVEKVVKGNASFQEKLVEYIFIINKYLLFFNK